MNQVNPPPRLLMGPGPVDADPRVLRAMAASLVGQFDPFMTGTMNEAMALWRTVWRTANEQTFLVDGTSRAGIEAALVSLLEPGDAVVVPVFGRFGHLLAEISARAGAVVHTVEAEWGGIVDPQAIADAVRRARPKVLAVVHGDTSTTVAQPLDELGAIAHEHDALLYVDATASLGGNDFRTDAWGLDVASAGLQKCLGGPSGSAPITVSPRAAAVIDARKHVEAGIRAPGDEPRGSRIQSNYLDLAQVMDYWGPRRLNHHTEATSMLYAARECARLLAEEGLDQAVARHALHGGAMLAGVQGLGLEVFGDLDHRMNNVVAVRIPAGVDGDGVRAALLTDFGIEIGTSFGPLHGVVWRIGTMGYNARRDAVLLTLAALEQVLRRSGVAVPPGGGVAAALAAYDDATAGPGGPGEPGGPGPGEPGGSGEPGEQHYVVKQCHSASTESTESDIAGGTHVAPRAPITADEPGATA
ncbi:pyridoxal-phosphate-dependent aminotransferase family protein [Antribacter gilvus]|uniref:pyridoxal-phosphate-dependent aminotransferase family protein n=1 Tax=Antribacter gilvus TaxID=2304675 RepID=UPI001F0C16DA|nr:alanine--glyoxylate aminotransferase family protein [Antribacter gilvus]